MNYIKNKIKNVLYQFIRYYFDCYILIEILKWNPAKKNGGGGAITWS